jgi:hypothetical protein
MLVCSYPFLNYRLLIVLSEDLTKDELNRIGQSLHEHRAGMNVGLVDVVDLEEFGMLLADYCSYKRN